MVSFGAVGAVSLTAPGDDCPVASARRAFHIGRLRQIMIAVALPRGNVPWKGDGRSNQDGYEPVS
jgi:hypothetical protein